MFHIESNGSAKANSFTFSDIRTTINAGTEIWQIQWETKDSGSPGVGAKILGEGDGNNGEMRLVMNFLLLLETRNMFALTLRC